MNLSIRKRKIIILSAYLLFCLLFKVSTSKAESVSVAVASNFLQPMQALAVLYENQTGIKVQVSSGSTGKLYAQIVHGAPYDLFFAANSSEPKKLEKMGNAIIGSRFTYAIGEIVLWSNLADEKSKTDIIEILTDSSLETLAIANPRIAPYGAAAMDVIRNLNISIKGMRIVRGENINQTWQFLRTGNADVGFIATSQLSDAENMINGYYIHIPANLYAPIEQQAVLLSSSKNKELANQFLNFIQRDDIKQKISNFGYRLLES